MNMDSITIDELDGEQRELAECVGVDNYKSLVRDFGGTSVYLQKEECLLKNQRNKKILEMFDGGNYKYLARHFKLSENRVREIVNENLN